MYWCHHLFMLLLFFCGSTTASNTQELVKRPLRVLTEEADTISVMARYTKEDSLFYLHQSYLSYAEGETYVYYEEFRKNRFWTLWQYKEMLKRERRRYSVYEEVLDGPQWQFTEDGKPLYYNHFTMGSEHPITRYWEYYPSGALKFVAEIKDDDFWNFLAYYRPSGEQHDFGDFADGTGTVLHLDDEGNPCLECQKIGQKTRGRILCDEQ